MDFGHAYQAYIRELYQGELCPSMFRMYDSYKRSAEEAAYEKDYRKLQEMFSGDAKMLRRLVKEQCDMLEYEGSAMFDECPDRYTVESLCLKIYRRIKPEEEAGWQCMNSPLYQMIQVMLISEMYFRRCRYRRNRRYDW